MAYSKINFAATTDLTVSRVGGLPLIADPTEWPKFPKTGQPLVLLLSITGDFLTPVFPEYVIPVGHCLSVFTVCDPGDYDTIVALQMNDSKDLPNPEKKGGSLVLLHKSAAAPCAAPVGSPPVIPMLRMSLETVPDGDDDMAKDSFAGDMVSKVGGMAGWAQDPVELEGMKYVLQLNEGLFGKGRHPHRRIFGGDAGFLLLDEKLVPGKAGIWIIQTA